MSSIAFGRRTWYQMPNKARKRMQMQGKKAKLTKFEKMQEQSIVLKKIRQDQLAEAQVEIIASSSDEDVQDATDPYMDRQKLRKFDKMKDQQAELPKEEKEHEVMSQGHIASNQGQKIADEGTHLQDMSLEAIEVAMEIEEVEKQIYDWEFVCDITDTQEPRW